MGFAITPTTNAIPACSSSFNAVNRTTTPNSGSLTLTDRSSCWRTRIKRTALPLVVCAVERSNTNGSNSSSSSDGGGKTKKGGGVPNSNYVVPLETTFPLTNSLARPLAEILRDLNKRIPENIVKPHDRDPTLIPWYHANRMLSFYAPGWCGEIRDVIFSDNGSVTVVYRVTVRGSDGEAHREATGTVSPSDGHIGDAVAAAEEIAFCKACARFGLGLYLYHEDQLASI
ncbi:hypothetical protein HN51_057886 [Arachis hypogaea]|uniref:DNA repair RAD52-like protein n=1 Tax=Arachis hypogaea TaxID=3818 RepID=A0A444WYJ9_ARAHY|nr:DNA repair RAD52-like protein 2, chloroplastic [Arachis ipaensis]XP_025681724.1 DNA repair RAD52-like protein 2, chloroplastic [Arachis hypogaea]QHN81012.1 uncharacterized protein DS421_20g683160 [Arachis hypogaea]RYQ82534.1 hypothetical protein Ahy_B10g101120 [Arachis hypogaea]